MNRIPYVTTSHTCISYFQYLHFPSRYLWSSSIEERPCIMKRNLEIVERLQLSNEVAEELLIFKC